MEGKDNHIFLVKQAIRSVGELKVSLGDWPQKREELIRDLHNRVGETNFRQAVEDLRFEAWNKPWTREARFIAKAAQMYNIPFGSASKKRLQKK